MGIFDFDNNGSDSNNWNYSDPNKPGYMPSIQGTVVQIDEVQELDYMTKQPKFFDNGNPRTNIRFTIQGDSGRELGWTFNPRKTGIAFQAVMNAVKAYNPQATGMKDVGGLRVKITTQGTSQEIGKNARQWWFEVMGPGEATFRGINAFVPQQQPQPVQQQQYAQQPQMQQPAPQIQGGFYAPPVPQQQSAQAQPAQQPAQHQVVPGNPQIIPDGNGGQVYDQDIPF